MPNISRFILLCAPVVLMACASSSTNEDLQTTEQASIVDLGRSRAQEVRAGATTVPLDESDRRLLASCGGFRDDGRVDRSALTPPLFLGDDPTHPTWSWKCQQTSHGPECCGSGINEADWQDAWTCSSGDDYQNVKEVAQSYRHYNPQSKLYAKDMHWHVYDLYSLRPTGGGVEVIGVADYEAHQEYSTPGDDSQGTETDIGNLENYWGVLGHISQSPISVNEGLLKYDIATGGLISGEAYVKQGRFDWFTFDGAAASLDSICSVLESGKGPR